MSGKHARVRVRRTLRLPRLPMIDGVHLAAWLFGAPLAVTLGSLVVLGLNATENYR